MHCLDGALFLRWSHTSVIFFPPPRRTHQVLLLQSSVHTTPLGDAAVSQTPEKNARKGRGSVCGNNNHEAPKCEANGAFKFKLMDFFFWSVK